MWSARTAKARWMWLTLILSGRSVCVMWRSPCFCSISTHSLATHVCNLTGRLQPYNRFMVNLWRQNSIQFQMTVSSVMPPIQCVKWGYRKVDTFQCVWKKTFSRGWNRRYKRNINWIYLSMTFPTSVFLRVKSLWSWKIFWSIPWHLITWVMLWQKDFWTITPFHLMHRSFMVLCR